MYMNKERLTMLLQLIKKLQEMEQENSVLNMYAWASDLADQTEQKSINELQSNCGTVACIAGWAATTKEFKEEGLHLSEVQWRSKEMYDINYNDLNGYTALAAFFNISVPMAQNLFDPYFYCELHLIPTNDTLLKHAEKRVKELLKHAETDHQYVKEFGTPYRSGVLLQCLLEAMQEAHFVKVLKTPDDVYEAIASYDGFRNSGLRFENGEFHFKEFSGYTAIARFFNMKFIDALLLFNPVFYLSTRPSLLIERMGSYIKAI